MPVTPLLPGRLPETYQFQRLGAQLGALQTESVQWQDRAATGVRIRVGGDDPAGAVQAGLLQRGVERTAGLRETVAAADDFLAATDRGLATFADAAISARSLLQAGVGTTATTAEKRGLALEVSALRDGVLNAANRTHRGRALFAGTGPGAGGAAFEQLGDGRTLYTGDLAGVPGRIADDATLPTALDGDAALAALTPAVSAPLHPALTASTPLSALHGGAGVDPGELTVTLTDGLGNTAEETVNLVGARTVGDLRTRLEAAFAGGAPTLSVGFTATGGGLELSVTPGGGAGAGVAVADVPGGRTGRDLALVPNPAPATPGVLSGGELSPRLTRFAPLSALNAGAGADASAGLRITQGNRSVDVDLSAAANVGEALAAIEQQAAAAGVHVLADLNEDGSGLAVRGRVGGADFSIGEAGGTLAADLGLRTFTPDTPLASLNGGAGVPTDSPLTLARRDGTTTEIDLSSAATVGDVLTLVNAADPGVLTATLNAAGNGFTLADASAPAPPATAGPLGVTANRTSEALGLSGEAAPGADLIGIDPNPQRTGGLPDLLTRLQVALEAGDDVELSRLDEALDDEIDRLTGARAEVGTRQRRLADRANALEDEDVELRAALSEALDTDLTEAFTRITALQTAYEATLRLTVQTSELSLVNFL